MRSSGRSISFAYVKPDIFWEMVTRARWNGFTGIYWKHFSVKSIAEICIDSIIIHLTVFKFFNLGVCSYFYTLELKSFQTAEEVKILYPSTK